MAGQYTIPVVIEQRPTGERASDVYSRLLTDRIIFLGTEIDDGVANVVIAQLLHLQSESQDSPIHLYINSPGGSITALLAVYDTIQYIKPTVATFCLGQAASAAAVLLAAGTPGNRHVLEHARVLLHQPSGGGEGTAADLEIQAREIARLREQVDEILHRHTGQPLAKLRTDTERDLILTAQQAVDYGLADRVVTTLKEVAGDQAERVRRPARSAVPTSPVGDGASAWAVSVGDARELVAAGRRRLAAAGAVRSTTTRPSASASCACAVPTRSTSRSPSARQTAASTSDDASLRPRSTSDRYATDTRASSATSRRVRPLTLPLLPQDRAHEPPQQRLGAVLEVRQVRRHRVLRGRRGAPATLAREARRPVSRRFCPERTSAVTGSQHRAGQRHVGRREPAPRQRAEDRHPRRLQREPLTEHAPVGLEPQELREVEPVVGEQRGRDRRAAAGAGRGRRRRSR